MSLLGSGPAPMRDRPLGAHVSLFGRVRVSVGECVLDDRAFPSRKAKQVFAQLALAHGAPVAKSQLVEANWGDRLPRNPMATLEHTVSILRSSCAGAGLPGLVATVHGGYRLDTSAASIDTLRFDQLVRSAARATPSCALELLREAVALARGDLLEDEPRAEWVAVARGEYRHRVERAALEAARLALMEDEPAVALELADHAQRLGLLPSEDAFHLQISARIRLGLRDDALRLLREAEETLERELGTYLPPATVALRELLRTPASAPARPRRLVLDVDLSRVPDPAPFVGRRREVAVLRAALDRVAAGGSAFVVVEGPAGVGKSRLLTEAVGAGTVEAGTVEAGTVEAGAVPVIRVACSASGRDLPRFTAVRVLRALGAQDGATAVGPPAVDAAGLFAQAAAVLAGCGPTVVVVDDLHLADDESVAVLAGLAGPGGVPRFGLLATRRPEGPAVAGADLVDLHPLTPAELGALGWADAGSVTGGNPLVLAACAEARRTGALSAATIDALAARAADAGALAWEVLVLLAASGRPVSAAEVAYLGGVATGTVAAALEELERRGLVRWDGRMAAPADAVTPAVLLAVAGSDRARSIRAGLARLAG